MMIDVTDKLFDELVTAAMDELPQEYIERLDNVLITYEDEPSQEQRTQLHLRCNQTLYGLYEGVPLTKRTDNYMALPDRITLFKKPLSWGVSTISELKEEIKRTLWHEIAHFYGLGHDRIHELESKQ